MFNFVVYIVLSSILYKGCNVIPQEFQGQNLAQQNLPTQPHKVVEVLKAWWLSIFGPS